MLFWNIILVKLDYIEVFKNQNQNQIFQTPDTWYKHNLASSRALHSYKVVCSVKLLSVYSDVSVSALFFR